MMQSKLGLNVSYLDLTNEWRDGGSVSLTPLRDVTKHVCEAEEGFDAKNDDGAV